MGTVLSQVQTSKLSKQGKTTTTGIFEGQPDNTAVSTGTTRPVSSSQQNPINVATDQPKALTYLEYMRNEKRI